MTLQAATTSLSAAEARPSRRSSPAPSGAPTSRMRDKRPLRYGAISAGFVHHTVNANDYTEAQVPAILRSIYAYHTQSRGWSDIGYNFLVDRFGRIWEGRYGGVDKPVVGAHTLGYNDYSFAMSAIGNFDTVQPPERDAQAYGALFAWKLVAARRQPGLDAPAGRPRRRSRRSTATATPARPPARAATSTPSSPTIRALAAAGRAGRRRRPGADQDRRPEPAVRPRAAPYPDLVVRRASDGRGFVLPTGGLTAFSKAHGRRPRAGTRRRRRWSRPT